MTIIVEPTIVWMFIICSWLIQLVSLIIKNFAVDMHLTSRDLVKRRLIENSLGKKLDQIEYEDLLIENKFLKGYSVSEVDRTYYASKEAVGPKRLAYNLAQSVFYTKTIYKEYRKKTWRTFLLLFIVMLTVIIFSLAYFTTELQIVLLVPITTILVVIIFENAEQTYRLDKDVEKYVKYDQRMYKLLEHNNFDLSDIMDVLTDYSSATKLSPPIPSDIYKAIKNSLEEQWSNRCNDLLKKNSENKKEDASLPQIFFDQAAEEFVNNRNKLKEIIHIILNDVNIKDVVSINISKISGNSNNDVFNFALQRQSADSIELFVKFYPNNNVFQKEKMALMKYAKKSDHFAKSIICEELERQLCIVFYHVQATSVNKFESVSKIISTTTDVTKLDYQGKLKNIATAFSSIYKILNNAESENNNAQNNVDYLKEIKPAELILDLDFFEYEMSDNTIYLKACKLVDVDFAENCSGQNTFDLDFINWSTEKNTVALTKINGCTIATILPRINYGKTKINFSRLPNKKFLLSLENYLKIKGICEVSINLSEKYENAINSIKSLNPQMVLCHNDFHAENLFVSETSFKVLDLSDVGYTLRYTDVCRMQASLLQHFLKTTEGAKIVDSFLLALDGKQTDNKASEFVFQLKTDYDININGNYNEYIHTLLIELILQCFYSICSTRRINEKWGKLLQGVVEITER